MNIGLLLRVALAARHQERSSGWSSEHLRAHQQRQLATLRRFVAERSAFYRAFHRGLEEKPLEALPILTKATLMAEFDGVVTHPALRRADLEAHLAGAQAGEPYLGRYTVLSTSGSTGLRGVFVFDRDEWVQALAAILRPLKWAEAPPPWTRPRSALIASGANWHYSAQVGRSLRSDWLPTLRLDAALPLAELVAELNAFQPVALAAYPRCCCAGRRADRRAPGHHAEAHRHQRRAAARGHARARSRRLRRRRLRHLRRHRIRAHRDECRAGNLHLFEDRAIVEVVDECGRAVPAGEPGARLLLTVLDRRAQPLIRYEISDGVRERPGRCACGRPFRMLERIEGRVEETLAFAAVNGDGSARGDSRGEHGHRRASVELHPNAFHDLLERVPASGWQVRQHGDGALTVLLTGAPQEGVSSALREQLIALLDQRGAQCPAIDVQWVDALPRGASGKAPLIVRVAGEPARRAA
ncbi:MAG: hypothetical protein U1F49_05405 [Rubrivivax sp.]